MRPIDDDRRATNVFCFVRSQKDLLPVTTKIDRGGVSVGLDHDGDCDDSLLLREEHLPDGSVYRWAAKLDGARVSDAMVGWIVLLIQISSYVILLTKSGKREVEDLLQATVIFKRKPAGSFFDCQHSNISDFSTTNYNTSSATINFTTENHAPMEEHTLEAFYGEPISYAISSIAFAVFLVLTFAGTDLRASWALLQTRDLYQAVLGLAILSSFVLLVMASISVLFFLANDNISFILGAAAVLFISDLDEKIGAALKTVSSSYRLFWEAEAIFLSVALAVVGIIWRGETTATTSDGISAPVQGLFSSEDDTESWVRKLNEDTVRAQMFNWIFACFIAPIGATVLAWEVAFVLQSVADRCEPRETTRSSSNLKQFVALEVFFLVNLALTLMELVFPQYFVLYDRVSFNGLVFPLVRLILPAVLTGVGVVGICLPCDKWRPHLSLCKALIGLGMGAIAFVSTAFVVGRKSLLPEIVFVIFAAAYWLTCIFFLAAAIFETFEGYPARFRVITWRFNTLGSSSSGDIGEGSSTIIGSAFVVLCMYVRLYVLEVLIYAIYFGDVKI